MDGSVQAVFGVHRTWRFCIVIFVIAAASEPLRRASLEHLPHAAVLRQRKPVSADSSDEHLLGVVTDLLLGPMLKERNTMLHPSLHSTWAELREQ